MSSIIAAGTKGKARSVRCICWEVCGESSSRALLAWWVGTQRELASLVDMRPAARSA